MGIYDDYLDDLSGGEEWCPICDEHYLPPWDYCKCIPQAKFDKKKFDEALEMVEKEMNKGYYIPHKRKKK